MRKLISLFVVTCIIFACMASVSQAQLFQRGLFAGAFANRACVNGQCEITAQPCEPVSQACEPVAPACEPVATVCEPAMTCENGQCARTGFGVRQGRLFESLRSRFAMFRR